MIGTGTVRVGSHKIIWGRCPVTNDEMGSMILSCIALETVDILHSYDSLTWLWCGKINLIFLLMLESTVLCRVVSGRGRDPCLPSVFYYRIYLPRKKSQYGFGGLIDFTTEVDNINQIMQTGGKGGRSTLHTHGHGQAQGCWTCLFYHNFSE